MRFKILFSGIFIVTLAGCSTVPPAPVATPEPARLAEPPKAAPQADRSEALLAQAEANSVLVFGANAQGAAVTVIGQGDREIA